MSTSDSDRRPRTIRGLKTYAKRLGRANGLSHTQALELAARKSGFQNYIHAVRALPERVGPVGHSLYITAYWRDANRAQSGRETFRLELQQPLAGVVTPRQLSRTPGQTRWFKIVAPDHLQHRLVLRHQDTARNAVLSAARTLMFMDATGLRPAPARRLREAYPRNDVRMHVPKRDHDATWVDPSTDRLLLTDEPYGPAVKGHDTERQQWAERHGMRILLSGWAGMWNPPATQLFLVERSGAGIPVDDVEAKLSRLPDPPIDWTGESGHYRPAFMSPAATGKKPSSPRDLQRKPYLRVGNSVGYTPVLGPPSRRPHGRMPVKAHQQAARLLNELHGRSYFRPGVNNPINRVRSELDDWVMREYTEKELPQEIFSKLYYGQDYAVGNRRITTGEAAGLMAKINLIDQILTTHYPQSAPLGYVTTMLKRASKAMERWVR